MIEIRAIEKEETYPIRKEELRKNVSLSHKMAGDQDPDTLHLGIFANDDLVGIVSLMKASMPFVDDSPLEVSSLEESSLEESPLEESLQYQIRGMATSGPHQGKGLGKMLLKEAEERLKAQGVQFVWCNARVVALDFYLKMGYVVHGPVFELPEIGPHYKMYKRL